MIIENPCQPQNGSGDGTVPTFAGRVEVMPILTADTAFASIPDVASSRTIPHFEHVQPFQI
jgi:hypothetical protein